jgi:cell migration-inducing and hyaluronan-binding protein
LKAENAQLHTGAWMGGSKMIANAGTINFYGKKRADSIMTRLTVEAFMGDTEIYVAPLLDWVAGDRIALAPTSFKYEASEEAFIESYDRETGKVTLT